MKHKRLRMGALSAAAIIPVMAIVSCSDSSNPFISGQGAVKPIFTDHYNEFVKEGQSFSKYASPEKDLLKVTQGADINLFFNSWGTITHTYMMRLALLANTEVHYGLISNIKPLAHQDKVNVNEFSRFLKTRTVNGGDSDVEVFPESDVFRIGADPDGRAVTRKWLDIIKKNPTKKINVFWNSLHLSHLNGGIISPADLSAFPNVNLILLEDGAVTGGQINPTVDTHQEVMETKTVDDMNKIDPVYLPDKFKSWKTYLSSESDVKRLNNLGMESYNYLDPQELFEEVFNTRGEDGTRLMAEWPKVSGLDWKDAKATLDKASTNGKKSMIILGSYGVDEKQFIKDIYDKFSDDYNLFYKGHPGHYQWNNYVKENYAGKIWLLDPMISSEELTKEHADQGMLFDKAACVGWTSAILGGFHNGYNDITKDLLAAYLGGKTVYYDDAKGTGNAELAKAFGTYWQSVTNQK